MGADREEGPELEDALKDSAPHGTMPLEHWNRLSDPWRGTSLRLTAFLCGLYLLLRLWLPTVRFLPASSAKLLSVFVFVSLTFLIAYHAARIRLALRAVLGTLAGAVVLWIVLLLLTPDAAWARSIGAPAADLAFLVACVFFGLLVARLFRDRNILLPAGLAVATVDLVGVYFGLTGKVLQNAPDIVANLSVKLPQIGGPPAAAGLPAGGILATMGGGDIVFLAAFFSAAVRLEMNVRGTFWYVYLLGLLAMVLALFVPGLTAIPALPFVVAGFLACNFHYFELTPGERWAMLYAGLVVVVVLLLCIVAVRFM
jgi:hypothetical protein